MIDVFISYASEDGASAVAVGKKLDEMSIPYFLAPKSLEGGVEFDAAILDALRECEEVFLLLTPNSLRSDWVKYEYAAALALNKRIVPILLRCSPDDVPSILSRKQTRDFHELDRLVKEFQERQVERKRGRPSRSPETPLQLITKNMKEHGVKYLDILTERLEFPETVAPLEFVENFGYDPDINLYPETYKDRIHIDTIHAGDSLPAEFYRAFMRNTTPKNRPADPSAKYTEEKDWGANYVALALAQALNLKGFYRVKIARTLLDFGRFPGVSPPETDHLNRLAINPPFSHCLNYNEKRKLLHEYYDRISSDMEKAVEDAILKIAIHTYDKYNSPHSAVEPGALRPTVSLLYSPVHQGEGKKIARGLFDKLYPDELAEFTADRRLTARISLNLERKAIPVAHNNPYLLPQGSMEVRSQVWFFFRYLRNEFEKENPAAAENEDYQRVWKMLLDTNLRSSESGMLRSYIHTFRVAPLAREHEMESSRKAYEAIEGFLERERDRILKGYRYSPERPSSLAIEIRKDYVWDFNDKMATDPVIGQQGVKTANVHYIASLLAEAIITYLNQDVTKSSDEDATWV